ncbi:MAG: hypothetical protein P4L69_24250 [Desulfosporosinus sp.]|nr:hypothetical protein [Desulfosporosinus sp.]
MIKNKLANITKGSGFCPLFQEKCKKEECDWFYNQFEKCSIEITGYNLFKLSKSIDTLIAELKKQ